MSDSADDFDKFRKNLILARKVKNISAKDLSIAAGLKQQKRILDIEEGRGKPSLEEIRAICLVLHQPIDNMLNNEARITLDWQFKLSVTQ